MGDGRHHADHDDLGAYVFELAQIAALPERSMLEGDALIPIAEPDAGRTVAVPWPPPWQLDVTRLGERAARGATHELHEAAAALASGAEVVTVHATIVPADHYTTTPMVLIVGPHRLAGHCHRLVRDVAPYLEPCELDLVSIPSGAGRARLRWEAPGLDEAAVVPGTWATAARRL